MMQNEMRDKLIGLIDTADEECKNSKSCKSCSGYGKGSLCRNYSIADHLLADGWIRPPCKVGDMVYRLKKRRGIWEILPREVVSITHRLDHLHRLVWEIFTTEQDRLGKTVFITREEAEKALKERENGEC